jgi:alkylated DNA nucleotide flippase Atl1
MLPEEESVRLPWQRVVAESGQVNRTKNRQGELQKARLETYGITVRSNGTIENTEDVLSRP